MPAAQIQYVDVGDAEVACRIMGDGPMDLCLVAGFGHIDLRRQPMEKLASLTRVIHYDRRGTGASDAVPDDAIPTSEEWTNDLKSVLDAVG